jgi:acyl-CoA reductase-like NAD-dependent aldehyde dehydrogenase
MVGDAEPRGVPDRSQGAQCGAALVNPRLDRLAEPLSEQREGVRDYLRSRKASGQGGIMNASPSISLSYPDCVYIGGKWTPASGGRIDVISAHTEELYTRVAAAAKADVERAVAAARMATDRGPWPRMTPGERAVYLRAIAKTLGEYAAELADAWTHEMGILNHVATARRAGPATFEYYAGLAETFEFEERHKPTMGEGVGLLVREPVGVVAAIVPWNAPMMVIAGKVAPALLAGCTVIVKAATEAPVEAYILAQVCDAVGLPPGVINVIAADREVSELLVRHPGVDKVSFTGSTAAGKKIGAICGERIARCTLELGGKSAALILDDYDMGTAAEALTRSAISLSGQVCAALTRVVVPQRHHNEFVDAMASAFKAVKVGDPFDRDTQLGPLAMKRQLERVEGYVAKGKAEGATLACGGSRPAGLNRGWFIEPTLFANVDRRSTIAQEEIFGPVVSVIPAKDEQDAIDIANDSMFGLNGAVFTNDVDAAYRTARRIRTGTVGHNAFRVDFGIAFGGFKQSGIGREGGREGMFPYLETKTVLLSAPPSHLKSA